MTASAPGPASPASGPGRPSRSSGATAPGAAAGSGPAGSTTATGGAAGRHAAEAQPSLGELVKDASGHLSTLVRGEIELAKIEVGGSVKNVGLGVGLFVGTLVLVVFALTFGFVALAEGLVAAGLWRWLAYLIVFAFLLLVAALFAVVGLRFVKKVSAPTRTIETTKDSIAVLRHPGAH